MPEDADALIIYAPQSDISADEKDMLLTYLQGGGKLLLVTDYTETAMPNLAEVMAYYGTSLADGIVWLTTSYMFNDDVDMLVSGANTDLFLNALDWMCQRESSISIRAKDLSTEYLTVPSSDVSTWSLILVVTLPLAFILAGAYITVTRRKR